MTELFKRPTARGGWIVRRVDRAERTDELRAAYQAWRRAQLESTAPELSRYQSMFGLHKPVTLPALKFLGQTKSN